MTDTAGPVPTGIPDDIFDIELPPHPYPGLRPFEKSEWPIFFGRETITGEVIERLIGKQFLALHGDSGSGKSSLIRAGVMPRLERNHARGGATWRTTSMLPRNAPLRNLATALATLQEEPPDAARVTDLRRTLNFGSKAAAYLSQQLRRGEHDYICILVDQFEEVFQHFEQGGAREVQQFVDVLTGLQQARAPGLHVILTMRSEVLGRCAIFEGLAEAINNTLFLLPRMNTQALLRAIREPARLYGGEVERELAETIIADSGRSQDQLPLMQHAMMLLVRNAVDKGNLRCEGERWRLELKAYRNTGGVAQLLSDHANEVVNRVSERAVDRTKTERVIERAFKALTTTSDDGYGIRRPRTMAQLMTVTGAGLAELLASLKPLAAGGVSFLKIFGREPYGESELVDISHEALIRNWNQLKLWMEDERKFRVWYEEVNRDLADWIAIVSPLSQKSIADSSALSQLSIRGEMPERPALGDNALLAGIRLDKAKSWWKVNSELIGLEIQRFIEVSEAVQIARNRSPFEAAVRGEALRRIAACSESGAKELDLGGLQLTTLDDEILKQLCTLTWLRRLFLGPRPRRFASKSSLLGCCLAHLIGRKQTTSGCLICWLSTASR